MSNLSLNENLNHSNEAKLSKKENFQEIEYRKHEKSLDSTEGNLEPMITSRSLPDLQDTVLSSSLEDSKNETTKRFVLVLGYMYTTFLFISGTLIFVSDFKISNQAISPVISLFIIAVGLGILCILLVDITRYSVNLRKSDDIISKPAEEMELDTEIQFQDSLATSWKVNKSKRNHDYCFLKGRHAGSAYLKFGAAAFTIGHLVHSGLLLLVQFNFMYNNHKCVDVVQHIVDLLYPIYSFIQLIFIFKYSNLAILKYQTAARVSFLHIIGGNLCLWSLAIARETQLAIRVYKWTVSQGNTSLIAMREDSDECTASPIIVKIFKEYSPYLYPFSVELNILLAGCFFAIWSNIGHCKHTKNDTPHEDTKSVPANRHYRDSKNRNSHTLNIQLSCHGSNWGLFAGIGVFVFLIFIIIIGFVFGTIKMSTSSSVSHNIDNYSKLCFHVAMMVTAIVAYNQTRHLDVTSHHIPLLDDVLLYICVPAFFMETLFTVVAAVNILNVVKLIDTTLMLPIVLYQSVQMVFQTAFIVDALRRCRNSIKLQRRKPGREAVLLLLITNVCMWILYTFSYKSSDSKDERYLYYGKVLWMQLGHLSAPLIMFYRFHSSVCIADIWYHAYLPDGED